MSEKLTKMAKIGDFSGIFLIKITDDDRYIITDSNLPDFIGRDSTDFFKLNNLFDPEAIERGFASYISYNPKTHLPYFIVAHLVFPTDELENPEGVLAVSSNITPNLKELLALDDHKYPVSFALLFPSSVVFSSTDPALRFHYFHPLTDKQRRIFIEEEPFTAKLLPDEPIKIDESIGAPFFEFEWENEAQIGYSKKLPGSNFSLLTYASKEEVFRSPILNFFNLYSVYGLILLIGGIAAYIVTKRMAKPIRSLSAVMEGIQKGDVQLRYQADFWGFEINNVGAIFNEMIDTLLEKKKVAEEERVQRETFASELRLGQQVQRSLLPQKMPSYRGVDVAQKYIPAIEVGGDFYDVYVNDDASLVLAIADASGKGVQACFYSLSLRNMLRTYVKEGDTLGKAIWATNNLFQEDSGDSGMFVTLAGGIYNRQKRVMSYFSAGHNPAIVRRTDGRVEILTHHDIALGILPTEKREGEEVKLEKGDTVVFYTDGVTEAHNEVFELFGEARLEKFLKEKGGGTASEIVEGIADRVSEFAGKAPQHDDITLLVMRVTE